MYQGAYLREQVISDPEPGGLSAQLCYARSESGRPVRRHLRQGRAAIRRQHFVQVPKNRGTFATLVSEILNLLCLKYKKACIRYIKCLASHFFFEIFDPFFVSVIL